MARRRDRPSSGFVALQYKPISQEAAGDQPSGLFVCGSTCRRPEKNRAFTVGRLPEEKVVRRGGEKMITPGEREFDQLASAGFNLIPVALEVAADLETPVSAFLKVARGDYAFLLESVRGGEKWGRYTFLGAEPARVVRARGHHMDLIRPGRAVESRSVDNPFEELRRELKRLRSPELPGLPRFFGGAVGFLAYDIVRCFEPRIPASVHDDLGVPDLYLMFTDTV
ncbi:MAG: hypothetical protein ACREQD_06175, partial [Candidatus Binataceae bacterium]